MASNRQDLTGFYDHFIKALDERNAALFIGAGMSVPAGFVNWKDLLRDVAQELGLDVDKETDLLAVAQYHINANKNRSRINRLLIDEYTKDAKPTENHRLIANLPVQTIWTTNYDNLLESAFADAGKRVDLKITKENLADTLPKRDVIIYKMHGDRQHPDDAVLTKENYEDYNVNRQLFSTSLQGDLVSKTFLFLGYSLNDPNVDYILSRIRILLGENKREHYCVMKRPAEPASKRGKAYEDHVYTSTKLNLRIEDLKRYGIKVLPIDDYPVITNMLRELLKRGTRNNIFVSGSAYDYEPMGRARLESLTYKIGQQIIEKKYNLVSGLGRGLGGIVVNGAIEAVYNDEHSNLDNRVFIRPFPPAIRANSEAKSKYRQGMIAKVGFTIFLAGNRYNENTKQVNLGIGTREEFDITVKGGKIPIPVGATGHVAAELWNEVTTDLKRYFGDKNVANHFKILNDSSKTDDEIVKAIFAIIELCNKG